jgi:hypothetical protein
MFEVEFPVPRLRVALGEQIAEGIALCAEDDGVQLVRKYDAGVASASHP